MKKYLVIFLLAVALTGLGSCTKHHHALPTFPVPTWSVDTTGKYSATMTAVVLVPPDLQPYVLRADQLAAFVGEECRGTATLVRSGSVEAFFVLIHGDPSEDVKLSFKYYSDWKATMYTTTAFLKFTVDGSYGSADGPQVLVMNGVRR